MIREIAISNFRSLGPGIVLHPGRLCVLAGPNGAGKSNCLDAIAFVRDAVVDGLPAAITHRGGIQSLRRRSVGHPFNVQLGLSLELPTGPAEYRVELTGDRVEEYRVKEETAEVWLDGERHRFSRIGQAFGGLAGAAPRFTDDALALGSLGGDRRFSPLVEALAGMAIYKIFPDTLGRPQVFDHTRPMLPHGENWVSVLRDSIRDPDTKRELLQALSKLTGDIQDVRVGRAAEFLVAEFRQASGSEKAKRWFGAGQQSDGTLRVAGILTALLQEPSLSVLGVEEPELTVHPGALPLIFDYVRQGTARSQVFITTHSPILLDLVDVEQDTILAVERRGSVTHIAAVSDNALAPVRRRLLRLGDVFVAGGLQLSLFDDEP